MGNFGVYSGNFMCMPQTHFGQSVTFFWP